MKFGIAIALACFATSANACDKFTSELWEPGVRTAVYEQGTLTITDHGKATEYDIISAGTGFPYRVAVAGNDVTGGLAVREYKGALIVAMEVFEKDCQ